MVEKEKAAGCGISKKLFTTTLGGDRCVAPFCAAGGVSADAGRLSIGGGSREAGGFLTSSPLPLVGGAVASWADAGVPSSVTFGDSFPTRGKPWRGLQPRGASSAPSGHLPQRGRLGGWRRQNTALRFCGVCCAGGQWPLLRRWAGVCDMRRFFMVGQGMMRSLLRCERVC